MHCTIFRRSSKIHVLCITDMGAGTRHLMRSVAVEGLMYYCDLLTPARYLATQGGVAG
jgi:hypothetical protein